MSKKDPGWVRRNVSRTVHPDAQSEDQAKRAPWVLLASLVAIVLIAGSVWALRVFVFEPSQATPAPVATETGDAPNPDPDPEPSTDPGETSCTLDNTGQDISGSAPTAARWVVERWAAIPEVDGAGPCDNRGDFRVGFAQTQTGAVLATYHYLVHGNTGSPDAGTRDLLEYAVLEGPLKAEILQDVDDVNNGVKTRVPDSNFDGVQILGYRIVSFENDQAVIEALIGASGSSSGSLTAKLVWQDDDWRIDPASAGEWSSPQRNVSPQGFVPWTPDAAGN